MRVNKALGAEQAAKLWKRKLYQIPSLFARLIFMAGLKASSGRYSDPELVNYTSRRICNRIIRDAHSETFREWLGLDLRAKMADLKPYLECLGKEDSHSLLGISFCRLSRDILPRSVTINEIAMFTDIVQTVMRLLIERDRWGGL
jgi:hypothetical protein